MAHIYGEGGRLVSQGGLFLPETDTCLTGCLLLGIKTAQVKCSKQRKKANTGTVKCKERKQQKKKTGAEKFRSFTEVKVEIKRCKEKLCRAAFKPYASKGKVLSARCTHYTEWDLYSLYTYI